MDFGQATCQKQKAGAFLRLVPEKHYSTDFHFRERMKTTGIIIGLFFVIITTTQAQTASSSSDYHIISRAADSQVWQRTTYETNQTSQVIPNVHQYTELASGLNYLKDGQWTPSKAEIDILPNGTAEAVQGQHQAYFPGDIYNGEIEQITPDGEKLNSQPLGLSYDDGTKTVFIAVLTNSVGYVEGSNVVIYPNAFVGVKADLRYTYTKAGFEQDVILQEQPPSPAAYGLNPATTKLQVLTEFFNPPQPQIEARQMANGETDDEDLTFGAMRMIPGRAFGINNRERGVSVQKQWVKEAGRQFLMEEVPLSNLKQALSQLPASQTTSIKPSGNSILNVVSRKRLWPAQRLATTTPKAHLTQVVRTTLPSKGLVMDYQAISGSPTNYTFQGDMTYYVSGTVNLYQVVEKFVHGLNANGNSASE
jgi:hypothetical protein